jgi:hypothetical protein
MNKAPVARIDTHVIDVPAVNAEKDEIAGR